MIGCPGLDAVALEFIGVAHRLGWGRLSWLTGNILPLQISPGQIAAEALLAQQHALSFGPPPPNPNSNAMDKLADSAKLVMRQFEADVALEEAARPSRPGVRVAAAIHGVGAVAGVARRVRAGLLRRRGVREGSRRGGLAAEHAVIRPRREAAPRLPARRVVDRSLSHFGNFVAHFANDLEQHHSVKTIHATTIDDVAGGADGVAGEFRPQGERDPTGPPAAGKSFVFFLLQNRLLPGFMLDCTSRFTKRGFETETDKMHCVFLFDEVANEVLGMDQYGRTQGRGTR